ncbi:MAG: ThiF family adenylyltransferase [Aerococcus sp.]|nr:ThiF family adenylyltransferase [Aerococcus sp.]
MEYRLCDSVQIFRDNNKEKITIRNYHQGLSISLNYQKELEKLLVYLTEFRNEADIFKAFPYVSSQSLSDTLKVLQKYSVINIRKGKTKKIKVMVIGAGTTGSHVIQGLASMSEILSIVIVDDDIVEMSNINRQNYFVTDIGKNKANVLKERNNHIDIRTVLSKIKEVSDILHIASDNEMDMIIQCGDIPSTRELGYMVSCAADKLNIPYITNSGYIGNVITLPEFYYPNKEYNFMYKHQSRDEVLVVTQMMEKAKYEIAIQPSLVILKQISDYCTDLSSVYLYRYRGYFDIYEMKWRLDYID